MFSKSVENGHFSQNSKGGTKGKFSKMADFLLQLPGVENMGNTIRLLA